MGQEISVQAYSCLNTASRAFAVCGGERGIFVLSFSVGREAERGQKIKRVQITQRGRQRQIALAVPLMSYHIVSFKVTPSAAIGPF